ncbi:hypothetical protein GQ53DRAFT_96896 [Thozetella sp. PMI_491]|nr:hypothetical protein GQ53DRAFT_96896 [Thozetella sp. PMI_491]
MDSRYQDQGLEDSYSHNPRSRANSGVSPTKARYYQPLHLVDASFSATSRTTTGTHPPAGPSSHSPPHTYISPPAPQPTTWTTPRKAPQPSSTLLDQHLFDEDWLKSQGPNTHNTPLLRIDPAPEDTQPFTSSPPPTTTRTTANMSAIALPYAHEFNMGPRSAMTWPVLGAESLLGHDLSPYATSDSSMTPPPSAGSRSVTSSPPRSVLLTPEQRELKRQRDQARRDNKIQVRARRSDSASSVYSQSPPVSLADLSPVPSSLPLYTSAPSGISLLAEPTSMGPNQYLPPFSPPLPSEPTMFPYPPTTYMGEYSTYATAPSLASHYAPRSIMPDPSLMYQVPAVMGSPTDSSQVRVVQSRPKPQCWEHGCNGRQFSTFSNLLRHQREKSGQAAKATCPNCGAEFTRTTARNGHLLHDKCKTKRSGSTSSN